MDQTAPEEPPLISEYRGRLRITCPWCGVSEPEEVFTEFQTPPDFPDQCGTVLKHGGRGGCKKIFSLRALRRPAGSVGA